MAPQYKWEEEASQKSCQVLQFTTKKNKMPGAPKQQSLLKLYICQKNQLFMGNILPTLDFFCFYLFFRFHIHSKKSLCQKFNMTPAFITFTQKCSTNMTKKKIISRDTLLFTVDVAPVGRLPIGKERVCTVHLGLKNKTLPDFNQLYALYCSSILSILFKLSTI